MSNAAKLALMVTVFLLAYLVPVDSSRVQGAAIESLLMLQDYARKHVLFCLVPAFFIAGAISVFVGRGSVMKYLGRGGNKMTAYAVAAVAGCVLAVCSCTVLPLFAGIYKRGAGLGPAIAFLYSGPAINVLAIIWTARLLGIELGLARVVGAVVFSVVIGLLMAMIFQGEEQRRETEEEGDSFEALTGEHQRPLYQTALFMVVMVLILIFAAWAKPQAESGLWWAIYKIHWFIVGPLVVVLLVMVTVWFKKDEVRQWVGATWDFALLILPLLFVGVLAAGFLLGMPGSGNGIIRPEWIGRLVGGNSLGANFFASLVGSLMYFATLTEVPILQGLVGGGMGQGPALALLLAGPALSLPSMLVIRSVIGMRRTVVFIALVVVMATITGMIYGSMLG